MFGATAPIESQNVVGYQSIELKAGFNMITPTFIGASAKDSSYDIQNIKLQDECDSYGYGTESIQIIDVDGNVSATYTWLSKEASGAEKDAWCDDSMTPVSVPLSQGQAFLLYTESEGLATVSGTVASSNDKNFFVALLSGFNGIGNASPVGTDIQTIRLSDENDSYGYGTESIQIIDIDGNVSATYTWLSKEASGAEKDAWCDDSMTPVQKTIKSGEGFLLYTEGEGVVELPTAL